MWHFGKYGFTSSVAYDPTKDRNSKSKFREIVLGEEGLEALKTPAKDRTAKQKALLKEAATTHILVRARIKEDLEDLRRVCKSLVIEEDKGADYAFRAVITRDLMKKMLSLHVDDIDYDSHFKEVVRDNSPKAEGRYSAMMSIWSAMAKLQPFTPWSGYSYGSYSGTGYTGGGTGGGYVSPFGSDAKKGSVTGAGSADAADDVKDFIEQYVNSGGERDYTMGRGPKTGFKMSDRVVGYSGAGEVMSVEHREGKPDMVTVKLDPKGNDKKGRVAKFVSNYLMPENLPDVDADVEVTIDAMYAEVLSAGNLGKVGYDVKDCDDDAFELLTRLQERHGEDAYVSKDQVDDVYDEILWENEDDEGKIKWVTDSIPIPSKYAHEEQQWINKALLSEDEAETAKQ